MNKKLTTSELLKQKSKKKLIQKEKPSKNKEVVVKHTKGIDKITLEIKSELGELHDIKRYFEVKKARAFELTDSIIKKLIYVRDNKQKLLGSKSFESYINDDIKLSKGHVYEQIRAYNLCMEYKKPGLYNKVDSRVLTNIAKEKDKNKQKELIKNARNLTRGDFSKKDNPKKFKNLTCTVNYDNLNITVENENILNAIIKYLKKEGCSIQSIE